MNGGYSLIFYISYGQVGCPPAQESVGLWLGDKRNPLIYTTISGALHQINPTNTVKYLAVTNI